MGELLYNLNIDLQALLVSLVGFLIVFLVLRATLFKAVGGMLTQRQHDIAETYDRIDRDKAEMAALKTDYERRLTGIEAEAREKINAAIREAQAMKDQILHDAQAQRDQIIAAGQAELARERAKALIELREQVVALTVGATRKVIGETLDESGQRALIHDYITHVGADTVPLGPPEER